MSIEPFWNGQITVSELSGAINLGLVYEGLSSTIATDILTPASFILSTINAKELIHLNWGVQTNNPGLLTVWGKSPTVDITDLGDSIDFDNLRADINNLTLVEFYENPVIANHGTNDVLGPIQVGVFGQQGGGGDSIGGILAPTQKIILPKNDFYIFEFVPGFDTTLIKMEALQYARDPLFNIGIE